MMHCWISVCGKTASIACGNPTSPSAQAIRISPPTVFQPIQKRKPEFRTFILANIHTKHVFAAFHVNPNCNINRTFYNPSFIAHMIMDGIHENNSVNTLQRPFLPFFYDGEHLVCNSGLYCQRFRYHTAPAYSFRYRLLSFL